MKAAYFHRFLPAISLCALFSGCADPVKISYPSEASTLFAERLLYVDWLEERALS
jgi:hypothetical protein